MNHQAIEDAIRQATEHLETDDVASKVVWQLHLQQLLMQKRELLKALSGCTPVHVNTTEAVLLGLVHADDLPYNEQNFHRALHLLRRAAAAGAFEAEH